MIWDKIHLGLLKKSLGHYWKSFWRWIETCGLGIFWVVLIIVGILIALAAFLGCVGGIIIGLPALVIYLAFNWVVPAFGGPAISYKVAVGILILIPIVCHLLHGKK